MVPTYDFYNAISKEDCKYIIDYCLTNYKLVSASMMNKDYKDGVVNHEERMTEVSFIDGVTERDKDIQSMMQNFITIANKDFFNFDISQFETVQFAKYEDGGHYNWHQDYFPDGKMVKREYPRSRKLSVTLNLSEYNESGGHLELFDGGQESRTKDDVKQMNSIGTAIVFDSREWHRITPIKKGIRYSLVCWSQGPYFK